MAKCSGLLAVGALSLQPALTQAQSKPIIVKIMPPEGDPTGLADVLIGALELTAAGPMTAIKRSDLSIAS